MLEKPTIKYRLQFAKIMPKGLKETSSLIEIGFSLAESAANTFTEERVDLQLNPLDNEVMIVYAINLDLQSPEAIAGTDTAVVASVTRTSQTAVQTLANSNTLATGNKAIRAGGFVDGGVGFSSVPQETPSTMIDYVGIIATNDFFVQVQGIGNANASGVSGRMYCARATASSDIYAALVQSEVLSS